MNIHRDVMVKENELMAYHLLKSALVEFSQSPAALTDAQKEKVSITAKRSLELENKILSSVEAQGIVIPTENIAQAVEEIEKRYETSDDFLMDLKLNRISIDALLSALQRELWVDAVLERFSSKVEKVPETIAETFYNNNKARFFVPERRKLSHILITVNDAYPENTYEKAKERITQIHFKLTCGADFAELALKNSECPTALEGGVLGTVVRGKLYPEIDQVAFSLSVGEVSGPVQTETGLHLVKCTEIHEGGQVAFVEAKEKILAFLNEKKCKEAQKRWLLSLGAA
jgi:peptidyl-prolyl cis-trans isomerase C